VSGGAGEPLQLVLASANPKKAAEIRDILGARVDLVARPPEVPDVVEDAGSFEGNARLKAVALCAATGLPALADDSGLVVDALDGAPGVYSARYAGEDATDAENVDKLLADLVSVGAATPDARSARFRCSIVVRWPDGHEVVADGTVEGHVTEAPRGESGFGYDPVFVASDTVGEDAGRTFGELPSDVKHRISHRGRALEKLAEALALPT
jgi:XTP/dITP diphosphohydrolase